MQEQELPSWNESEFLTFTLLYCAHIDMNWDEEEKRMIQNYLDKESYIRVRDTFRSLNDAECIDIIRAFKGLYYPTPARKQAVLDRVKKLFLVDGEFGELEKGVYFSLDRLL